MYQYVMPTEQIDYQKPNFKIFMGTSLSFDSGSDASSHMVNPTGYI